MPNILDYVDWRGDLSFDLSPFGDIDNLIMSMLCFVNFEDIVPEGHTDGDISLSDAADIFFANEERANESYGYIIPSKEIIALFRGMSHTVRYGELRLSAYVTLNDLEGEEQFAALTVGLPDGTKYIAFRGTDDSLVGWKEDMQLSYLFPVRAQSSAVAYLEDAAKQYPDAPLLVGGHSKGGNLAFYAAAYSNDEVKSRLLRVWSNDGPGFFKRIVNGEAYSSVKDKFVAILPECSVIGRLFDNDAKEIIVKSNAKGLYQHDLFSWELIGNSLLLADGFSDDSTVIRRAFRHWIADIDAKGREDFVAALFRLIEASGAQTLSALFSDRFHSLRTALRTVTDLSKEQKDMLLSFVTFLVNLPVR